MQMQMQLHIAQPRAPPPQAKLEYYTVALVHQLQGRNRMAKWPSTGRCLHLASAIQKIGPLLRLPRIASPGPHIHAMSRPYNNRMFSPQLSPDFSSSFPHFPAVFPRSRDECPAKVSPFTPDKLVTDPELESNKHHLEIPTCALAFRE